MKRIAFLLAGLGLTASLPAAIQQMPTGDSWEGLSVSYTAGSSRWFVRTSGQSNYLMIGTEPLGAEYAARLVVSNTAECLCIDARAAFAGGATKIVMQYPAIDAEPYWGKDVMTVTDWAGTSSAQVQTYLEGRSADGKHWYRSGIFTPKTRRAEYRHATTVDEGVNSLHWRFDILKPGAGEIRLYRARVGLYEELEQKLPDYGARELTFYANFDGTNATADVGAGGREPVIDKNLSFPQGLRGRALLVGSSGALAYPAPGNVRSECGTLSFWFRSQSTPADRDDLPGHLWQTILNLQSKERGGDVGSPNDGSLWFWWYNKWLRRDLGDLDRTYACLDKTYYPSDYEQWHHYVITWNAAGSTAYVDGGVNVSTTDRTAPQLTALNSAVSLMDFDRSGATFEKFWLGCMANWKQTGGNYQCRGFLDEVKIWSAPMTRDEAIALYDAEQDAKLSLADEYGTAGKAETLRVTVVAQNGRDLTGLVPILVDSASATVATGAPLDATGGVRTIAATLPAGEYAVTLAATVGDAPVAKRVSYWVLSSGNAVEGPATATPGEVSEKELLYTVIPSNGLPSSAFCSAGTCTEGSLAGTRYLEAGTNLNDRFALRLSFDTADPLHLVEIDYPDDRKRTMDFVLQDAAAPNNDYTMQVGVYTGGELPLSGRILTHRCLYWTRAADVALIAMSARKGEPAAVSAVRVYRVPDGKLPVTRVDARARVPAGWGRHVGSYWEDPAIGYDFASGQETAAAFGTLIDRMAAYMKFTGRDLFAYPGAWYHGLIAHEHYNPRTHPHRFLQGWFRKFDEEGLFLVPTVNLQTIPFPEGVCTRTSMRDGSLHPTSIAIFDTGYPNWGGWHGTPPYFNIAHADVQAEIEKIFDGLLADGADHPSFKGICLHLVRLNCLWWGSIESGYNDYSVADFEKATGIAVSVADRTSATRGRDYAAWLKANAYDEWVAWRCGVVTAFYAKLAEKLRRARGDLKLWLNPWLKLDSTEADYGQSGHVRRKLREAGFDETALVRTIPNVVIGSTIVPVDWRKGTIGGSTEEISEISRTIQTSADMTSQFDAGGYTWSQFHDRYWEDAVGSGATALKSDWLKETTWRVSTLNPSGADAMEPYAKTLANRDVKAFSRGGFLIGCYGMEPALARFAQALRALPTNDFETVSRTDDVVERRTVAQGRTWTYLVNATNETRTVAPSVGPWTQDLATGEWIGSRITLAPYELRAFAGLTDAERESLSDAYVPDPRDGTTVWNVGDAATAYVQDGVLYVRGTGAVTNAPWTSVAPSVGKVKVAGGITSLPAGAFEGLSDLADVNGMALSAFNGAAAGAVRAGGFTAVAIDPATQTGTVTFRVQRATDADAAEGDWTPVDATGATVEGTAIRVPVPATGPTGFFRLKSSD